MTRENWKLGLCLSLTHSLPLFITVAFRFVDAANAVERAKSSGIDNVSITVCDINTEMLRVGERRARERFGHAILDDSMALAFVQGNAQDLHQFDDNTFDLYTIAFGLRNVTNVDAALTEARRVLKPGGRFMCLEFSQVPDPILRQIYDTYSFNIIPWMGEVVASDRASYQYLVVRPLHSRRHYLSKISFEIITDTFAFGTGEYSALFGSRRIGTTNAIGWFHQCPVHQLDGWHSGLARGMERNLIMNYQVDNSKYWNTIIREFRQSEVYNVSYSST